MVKPMWKVAAGRGGQFADLFLADSVVAIGWHQIGDVTNVRSADELVPKLEAELPGLPAKFYPVSAGTIIRFLRGMQNGDSVVVYNPATRLYHLGVVTGTALWNGAAPESARTQRAVSWQSTVARDSLTQATRNALGGIATMYRVADFAVAELLGQTGAQPPAVAPVQNEVEAASEIDPYAQINDLALERIKDRIAQLDWEQMQALVAALLRALGYRTQISARGPDRGRDILATTDGFGFRPPRIFVEVKHRTGTAIGAPDVRAMPVGSHADDRGLFVSTGGFTREAYYEAERGQKPVSLMTLDDLTRAILDAYPNFDDEGRALLPLRRLYWPLD